MFHKLVYTKDLNNKEERQITVGFDTSLWDLNMRTLHALIQSGTRKQLSSNRGKGVSQFRVEHLHEALGNIKQTGRKY